MRWWLAVGAMGMAASVGCGEGPGREDVLLDGVVHRFCEKMAECGCLSPEELASCTPSNDGFDQDSLPPELAYDPRCAEQLEGLIGSLSCTDPQPLTFADLCPLYHGTLFEGQPCGYADPFRGAGIGGGGGDEYLGDCGSGLQCILGECRDPQTVEFGGEGQPCDLTGCDEGLLCVDGQTCSRLPGPGEPCPDGSCREDSRCVFDPTGGEEPRCEALADIGQPCMGHVECVSGNCPAGFCVAPAGAGSECGSNLPCGEGFECVPVLDPGTGLQGGACSPIVGFAGDARCESFFEAFYFQLGG